MAPRGVVPAAHESDEAKDVLEQIKTLCWKRDLERSKAELSNHELGGLLKRCKERKLSEAAEGISFDAFVATLLDRNNQPRSLPWANKMIETHKMLEDWPVLRTYHRDRILSPDATPCQSPGKIQPGTVPRTACVSDATCFHAVKLLKAQRWVEETLSERDLHGGDDTTPAQRAAQVKLEAEKKAIVYAHLTTAALKDLIKKANGTEDEEDDELVTITLKLDPNVAEGFESCLRLVCGLELHGEGDAIDFDKASSTQRVERLVAFVESMRSQAERMMGLTKKRKKGGKPKGDEESE